MKYTAQSHQIKSFKSISSEVVNACDSASMYHSTTIIGTEQKLRPDIFDLKNCSHLPWLKHLQNRKILSYYQ